jgi:aryl-alcohol dehydrogenase-like predicted oxidoreductase
VIATKGGFVRGGPEYSDMSAVGTKQYLRQAAYMSLRRLGLDHIDLYYLHTPTMTDAPFEEIIETLAGLRQDGLIRHIGLSNVSAGQLRTALTITGIAAVTVYYNVAVRLGAAVRAWRPSAASCSRPGTPARCPAGRTAPGSARSSTRSPRGTTRPRNRSRSPGSSSTRPARCRFPARQARGTSRRTSPRRASS